MLTGFTVVAPTLREGLALIPQELHACTKCVFSRKCFVAVMEKTPPEVSLQRKVKDYIRLGFVKRLSNTIEEVKGC